MKSGVFDGASDTFKLMDQGNTREDMQHAWYDEGDGLHPFDRTTNPVAKNDIDTDGKYSWSTAVRHSDNGRLEAGPLARQLIAGGDHGESWQHSDGLVLDMYRKLGGASILVWGSEEQKQFFLKLIFRGEVRTWQLLSEPEAGSDLANVKTTAIRDGDDYVINGQKVFVGSGLGCDYMWTITVTDTEAKRHENLGWFMIKADLPGITIQPMDLLISGGESGAGSGVKNTVFFDNVRVPAFNLIGGENQGWKVATTHLELEHGTGGRISRNWLVDRMFEYCQTTQRRGQPMSKDPEVRDRLVDIYIEAEITRLFNLRNYWMRHSGANITYEGPQASYFRKQSGLRQATAILDILGPAAMTYDPELGAGEGHVEAYMRSALVALHPGGTTDIQKVIMARRIGIGREVKEKAGALA